MKKFLVLFLFCLLVQPVMAMNEEIINNIPDDEYLEKQIEYIYPKLAVANKNNDLEELFNIAVEGYNIKKKGNPEHIKLVNDMFSAFAIKFSADRYHLTQDKKYLKKAYKWSQIAVKDKTSQIYSIEADIMLAGAYLDINEMKNAYDLYRAVDFQKASAVYDEYSNLLNSAISYKNERTQIKKDNLRAGLVVFFGSVAKGAKNMADTQSQFANPYGYNNQTIIINTPPCQTITPTYIPTN